MYTSFFGINEKPFSITPDPRYLFMSERHGEALAHLVYGVTESGGFIQLTGEVGTGKTTLVRTLLSNQLPDNANVAVVLNPQQTALEFLQSICEELHLDLPPDKGSSKALIDLLNDHLLRAHADGRRTILVVDEAQNLRPDVLEQVRLLTNLETSKQKLLQIILIGQPELRQLLSRNDLRQLAQRITGRYHLEPLSLDETARYIEHRMKVAGALGEIFDPSAKKEVFAISQGVPRLINVICDRALLGAFTLETRKVNKRLVRRAAAEISGQDLPNAGRRWLLPVFGSLVLAVIVAGVWVFMQRQQIVDKAIADIAQVAAATLPAETAAEPVATAAEQAVSVPDPAPVAESAAPAEVQASLDEQLQLADGLTDTQAAFETLFDIWGIEFNGALGNGCTQAEAAGYACMYQRGSWSGLKQFNRPAMLTLTDTRGQTHKVVLSAIRDGAAELSIAGVTVTHPVAAVTELWFGEYLLLWQPPNGEILSLQSGMRHPNVAWLRASLAAIDGKYAPPSTEPDYYDAALAAAVRDFQQDKRIDVDGLAGPQTQIIINSSLASDGTPKLAQE
jgi:general secretion pathway protein A